MHKFDVDFTFLRTTTALCIFYKLNRLSEDLDFSLLKENRKFRWNEYLPFIRDELESFGFDLTIEPKEKLFDSQIHSPFVKGGTVIQLAKILPPEIPIPGISKGEQIRIKLEIDTNPPQSAGYEVKYQLLPIPFSVRLFDKPSLFAGKVHPLLCRNWSNRVKGRDFYDYVCYLSWQTPLNIRHLEERMIQSGHLEREFRLNSTSLLEMLMERISKLDFKQARLDILPFIKNPKELDLWTKDFFITITKDKLNIQD